MQDFNVIRSSLCLQPLSQTNQPHNMHFGIGHIVKDVRSFCTFMSQLPVYGQYISESLGTYNGNVNEYVYQQ